jgi:hypothetical protein
LGRIESLCPIDYKVSPLWINYNKKAFLVPHPLVANNGTVIDGQRKIRIGNLSS